jgi:type II secretory pathway component PulF
VFALFGFVLPNIFDIADSFVGMDLPLMTRILRNISDFVVVNRKILLYSTGGIGLLGWLFFSTDTGKRSWFNIILSIPLI